MNHMHHPERNRLARKGIALLCVLVASLFLAPFLLVASGVNLGMPQPGVGLRRHHVHPPYIRKPRERGPCICLPHTPHNPF
jgi:hypothetical protein